MQPETQYARLGPDRIAYQVLGDGPPDLVLAPGNFGHVDIVWEDPGFALFCRMLASFSRLILFDRRGAGASDPLPPNPLPLWESQAEELTAVLDEIDSQQTALLADTDAGPAALFFAATNPARTSALILGHTTAKYVRSDDYPFGVPSEAVEAFIAQLDQIWGTEAMAAMLIPSRAGDQRFCRWFAKLQRTAVNPRAAQAFIRSSLEADVRPVLPLIQAPTLILWRPDTVILPIEHGRYLTEHIPTAKLVELPGTDVPLYWQTPELALDHIEEFHGQLVKTTGDGILATLDGPGRAVGCAADLRDELHGIGLQIRAGLHTGEVEQRDGDIGGIAVHIAARVMAAAGPAEILTSRTVRDLVVGSDITLNDRGPQPLKGVEGTWQLFALVGH